MGDEQRLQTHGTDSAGSALFTPYESGRTSCCYSRSAMHIYTAARSMRRVPFSRSILLNIYFLNTHIPQFKVHIVQLNLFKRMHRSFNVVLKALFAIIRQRALQLGDSYVNKAILVRSIKPLL